MRLRNVQVLISLILTLVVSISLGFLAVKNGPPVKDLRASLEKMGLLSVLFSLGWDLLQNFFMMLRLWVLGKASARHLPFVQGMKAIAIGQSVNMVVPARLGDFLKILLLTGHPPHRLPLAAATGVMAADKLVDTLVFFLWLPLSGAAFYPPFWEKADIKSLVIGLPLLGLLVWGTTKWATQGRSSPFKDKWLEWKKGMLEGLRFQSLLPASLFGSLVWLSEAMALQQLAHSLHFNLSLAQLFFVFMLLNLAIAIPVSIGNLGVFEAALVGGLQLVGIPLSDAIVIAVMHHVLQVGAVFLWALVLLPITLPEIRKAFKKACVNL